MRHVVKTIGLPPRIRDEESPQPLLCLALLPPTQRKSKPRRLSASCRSSINAACKRLRVATSCGGRAESAPQRRRHFCMSSLRRGHASLLCMVPLVSVISVLSNDGAIRGLWPNRRPHLESLFRPHTCIAEFGPNLAQIGRFGPNSADVGRIRPKFGSDHLWPKSEENIPPLSRLEAAPIRPSLALMRLQLTSLTKLRPVPENIGIEFHRRSESRSSPGVARMISQQPASQGPPVHRLGVSGGSSVTEWIPRGPPSRLAQPKLNPKICAQSSDVDDGLRLSKSGFGCKADLVGPDPIRWIGSGPTKSASQPNPELERRSPSSNSEL